MQHLERHFTHLHAVPFFQPASWRQRRTLFQTKHPALCRQTIQPESIFLVRTVDRYLIVFRQLSRCPYVIEMAVRQQDLRDRHALPGNFGL
ncbi:hypothetical protein D3C76_1186510 [compost metagenome]